MRCLTFQKYSSFAMQESQSKSSTKEKVCCFIGAPGAVALALQPVPDQPGSAAAVLQHLTAALVAEPWTTQDLLHGTVNFGAAEQLQRLQICSTDPKLERHTCA